MKSFTFGILLLACFALAFSDSEEETKEFKDDIHELHDAIHDETKAEKAITDFVTKYGKKRICKHLKQEWKKMGDDKQSEENKTLQDSCNDEKQGDKEFIKVVVEAFKKFRESETVEFREALVEVHKAIHDSKDAAKALTDFVTKYGKTRVCKYLAKEWDGHGDLSDQNKAMQSSCNDEKHGDKEFIEVLKKLFVKT